jgi:hypothetical protein
MPQPYAEIHIGDIGTQYRVRITDLAAPFDPTTAATKQLIFLMPDSSVVTRDALAEQVGDDWFLTYIVTSGTFHAVAGDISVQAKLTYADGQVYHSNIQTRDSYDVPLRIFANLD